MRKNKIKNLQNSHVTFLPLHLLLSKSIYFDTPSLSSASKPFNFALSCSNCSLASFSIKSPLPLLNSSLVGQLFFVSNIACSSIILKVESKIKSFLFGSFPISSVTGRTESKTDAIPSIARFFCSQYSQTDRKSVSNSSLVFSLEPPNCSGDFGILFKLNYFY